MERRNLSSKCLTENVKYKPLFFGSPSSPVDCDAPTPSVHQGAHGSLPLVHINILGGQVCVLRDGMAYMAQSSDQFWRAEPAPQLPGVMCVSPTPVVR
jgi:hypothetical protein